MTAPRDTTVDWERVEAQYGVGTMSLREIASEHGITEGAIRKRAKKDGWTRDLTARVKAKADEAVRKALVRDEVRKSGSAYQNPTEKEVVEVEAQVQARIRLEHRGVIGRMRTLVQTLIAQCEVESGDPQVFQEIGEILRAPDDRGNDRLNDAYQKAISLPTRIKGVKELADTLKTLIGMEREAFGIAGSESPDDPTKQPIDDAETIRRLAFAFTRAAQQG